MISTAVTCIAGYLVAKLYLRRERKTLSDSWLLDHQRREGSQGLPDQICWRWPFKGYR